eukprot:1925436-Pyramimonas_sp.AAC.1
MRALDNVVAHVMFEHHVRARRFVVLQKLEHVRFHLALKICSQVPRRGIYTPLKPRELLAGQWGQY